ncbi:hypothetical protein CL659_01855 [bacterium]|nr:hypothetical protein [bacterium]|tara:strand:- start:12644 stop:13030 length:387 start_codon:yes stop_codon:yes gene_type:complete
MKKWIILISVLLIGLTLANLDIFNKTSTTEDKTLEVQESKEELDGLWNVYDHVSINHDGTILELLEEIKTNSNFEINLDISEEALASMNERFTLVVDMKVYEIIGLVSQSIGLKTVISDDYKEVLIHD